MFVLDSHCDTPSQILRLRDLSKDNEYAHVDFPKLKRGESTVLFLPCMFLQGWILIRRPHLNMLPNFWME